ncbi:MAG: OmpA family protein [Gammaproteobacteria bacterium]|nr:OmpA family protein [Gammaproteobacteria bacterium]
MNYKTFTLAIAMSAFAFSTSVMAGDDKVETYVNSSSGEAVTTTRGDCVRTTRKDSADKREDCGYAKPMQKSMEIVKTPSAVSVTAKIDEEVMIAAAILFDFDSDVLSDDGKLVIDERIARFSGYKKTNIDIKVIGHTDSTGPEAYNQKLSERRAQSVASYIEQMKQSPDANVEATGMGESQPMASNDTREGRAANRRVKILVTGTAQK